MTVHQFEDNAAKGAQGYAINWDTAEARVKDLKAYLMNAPQVMDPERLQFLNEVYEEFQGEPVFYIRAKLLERVLTKKKIFLDGNPIVGTLTGTRAGVYAYPEWNVAWIKEEMQMAKMASLGEMKIPQETTELLEKTYKKWKGRTCIDLNNKMFKDKYGFNPAPYSKAGVYYDNVSVASGSGIADYPLALNKGLRWVIDDIKKRLLECPTTLANKEKHDLYRAMIVATEAVIAHSHRYADLAEKTAETETDPKAKAELLEIAEICRRVPEFPARNFREAIQSFWFIHLAIEVEQMACACSPGRYGQYMYPFYKKDIEEGNLTREQVLTLLKFQWIKHLELAEYQGGSYAMTLSGHTGQSITIGGVDLRHIRRSDLRRHIGLVLQEPFLFSQTIGENIRAVRPDAPEDAMRRAAAIACVDDAVTSFPEGYDTIVGERGVTLSGGQKQRVAIARMLMQQAPVMIFDDSLSAVDAETDEKIRTALRRSTGNATVLLISHRVTTLMQADRILVLDGGRVAELGTHAQLVEKPGIYRDIYNIQMQSADRALLEEGGSEHGSH